MAGGGDGGGGGGGRGGGRGEGEGAWAEDLLHPASLESCFHGGEVGVNKRLSLLRMLGLGRSSDVSSPSSFPPFDSSFVLGGRRGGSGGVEGG